MISESELSRMDELAVELASWAAAQILAHPAQGSWSKAHPADLATDLDQRIEAEVVRRLVESFPGHRVIGEEFGDNGAPADAPTWLCDPIDGTTNYASGLGWCSFSLACRDDSGTVLAVVADPWRGEVLHARRGRGSDSTHIGAPGFNPVRASSATELGGGVVLTEWAAHQPWAGMLPMIGVLAEEFATVRIMGSSALSIAQVAAGRALACLIGDYSPIDDDAAALIASEAGATVTTLSGHPELRPGSGGLLVAAPGITDTIVQAWRTVQDQPQKA